MGPLSAYSHRGGLRFAAFTAAMFLLMLAPCALGVGCQAGWLPASLLDELMAVSISGAAVGSCALLRRMCCLR